MTAKSHDVAPYSRLARMGLGLGFKSHSSSPRPRNRISGRAQDDEDNWYIPYNGPYEPPKPALRQERERDSWGDSIRGEGDEDDGHILGDPELHNRYGVQDVQRPGSDDWRADSEERKGRPRVRTQSGVSGRTTSSGTVDPGRASVGVPRRSTVSSGSNAPPIPSYINLDTAGGVGESPIPPVRRVSQSTRRKSFVSLLTFSKTSSKKMPPSPKVDRQHTPTSATSVPGGERVVSRASNRDVVTNITRLRSNSGVAESSLRGSGATDFADFYDSYYSTFTIPQNTYGGPHQNIDKAEDLQISGVRQPSPQKDLNSPVSEPSSALHPYAYAVSTIPPAETPLSAPPPKTHFDQRPTYHRYAEPPKVDPPSRITNSVTVPQFTLHPPDHNVLKNSISTPELRGTKRTTNRLKKPSLPKMKDRWLSAETWCDALLFPRPRLKVKHDDPPSNSGSGRIVSPPGSPVVDYFGRTISPQPGVASRVLAHSRSLMDLSLPGPSTGEQRNPLEVSAKLFPIAAAPQNAQQASSGLRPPRPKSWALDDLALPSPVPSLARVLEEGQILEHQRKKWQTQAISSFQNQRARSLSRARTKSLTNKQTKRKDPSLSTFDFLAARGLLGNQDIIPVNPPKLPRVRADSQTESRGTVGKSSNGKSSYEHSSSLSKTGSKSSRSHSRNHSRSESFGKSAKKLVKATAKSTAAICGVDETLLSPNEEKNGIESALRNNTTKVIRLADPAQMPLESALTIRSGTSPTPSGQSRISDTRMGIALTTPPITDDSIDRDSIAMPAHPYAQGGFSAYAPSSIPANDLRDRVDFDYAGPHPTSVPSQQQEEGPHDLAARHRLPPQALHPYAQAGFARDRDSYQSEVKVIPHVRANSQVAPPDKMWAEWSSGVVREILPNEIQYSPFLPSPRPENAVYRQARNSSAIYDTVGVGETLVSAIQRLSRDSGVGTSEEHVFAQGEPEMRSAAENLGTAPSRVRRSPVQYDVSQPPYIQKFMSPPVSSSPLAVQDPMLLGAGLRQDSSESAGNTSSNSSPPVSPPPLGDVDDLETFRDLFYRPSRLRNPPVDVSPALNSQSPDIPSDVHSVGHQRGSGLTSIARQLSEELEENRSRANSFGHSLSLSSRSSLSALRQSAYSARTPPADTSLQFVFSDIQNAVPLGDNEETPSAEGTIMAFQPSIQIPEDVESSRASSPAGSLVENNELDVFRFGHVESVSTPPAVSGDYRASFQGQMAFANGEDVQREHQERLSGAPFVTLPAATAHSSLQPSSADPTRSSYLTTSDGSRMSGLSDFPAPPPQPLTSAHMTLLSSYFDETLTARELAEVQARGHINSGPRSRSGSVLTSRPEARAVNDVPSTDEQSQSRRLTFGNNEEIDDLLANLSSHT